MRSFSGSAAERLLVGDRAPQPGGDGLFLDLLQPRRDAGLAEILLRQHVGRRPATRSSAPRRCRPGTRPSRRDCGSRSWSGGTRCPRRVTGLPWCSAARSAFSCPFCWRGSLRESPHNISRRRVSRDADLASARAPDRLVSSLCLTPWSRGLGRPRLVRCGTSGRSSSRHDRRLSPAPLRQAERLRRPFQESARRDFRTTRAEQSEARTTLPSRQGLVRRV